MLRVDIWVCIEIGITHLGMCFLRVPVVWVGLKGNPKEH